MRKGLVLVFVCCLGVSSACAQFGLSKLSVGKKDAATDPTQTLAQCGDLVKYVTLATDQGVLAMDSLAAAFPPEKIAKFSELSKQYHELQKNRPDGNIDAEGVQLASQMGAEWDKISSDWQSYGKEHAKVVRTADKRLALMVLADGVAGTKVPPTLNSVQSTITSLGQNPMQAGKVGQLKSYAQLFTVISQELPKQIKSANNVRGVAKQIATAEKMTLAPDPSASSLSDATKLQSAAHDIPDEEKPGM